MLPSPTAAATRLTGLRRTSPQANTPGTLELWPAPVAAARGATAEQIPLRAGHVVARPPGTRIAHSFLAGPDGLTMLIYGTRQPNDMAWYPRSNKIFWRGLGVIGRIESLEYGDGEPDD